MSQTSLRAYAEAYVQCLPNERDAVKEFDAIASEILAAKQVRSFIGDVSVPLTTRREALQIAFPKAAEQTVNLLILLAKDERLDSLESLSAYIRTAAAGKAGKRHAIVTSAVPLTGKDLTRIEQTLATLHDRDIQLEERIDGALLTGFSVTVDGWTFDASLKGTLNRLQHALTV